MLTADRKFIVSSLHKCLIKYVCGFQQKFPWKIKIPSKIKCFVAYGQEFIVTKYNLLKRGLKGGKMCVYSGNDENIDHLFFQCLVAELIWSFLKCAIDLQSTHASLFDCFGRWIKDFPKHHRQLVPLLQCFGQSGNVEMILFLRGKLYLIL